MNVYLDWNATSPLHPSVSSAMGQAEQVAWANPSSVHQAGRLARNIVEDCRESLGRLLHFSPRDILFTGGGTEANHLALNGARWLVTSRIEHPSVVAQAEALQQAGARVVFAQVNAEGVVTAEAIDSALKEVMAQELFEERDQSLGGLNNQNTPLVAVMALNHETGVFQPIEEIAACVHQQGARLHVDAVQLVGKADLRILQGADSVALAAHKFRGPKGLGVLGFNCGWNPSPVSRGGAQERGLRPGTVDAVAIAGLAAAIARLPESGKGYERAAELGRNLERTLLCEGRGIVLHGDPSQRAGHVINMRAPGWKGDELVAALDLQSICISSGSACSAGSSEPSPIIEAMLGREAATGAVRISFGEESTPEHAEALVEALRRLGVLRGLDTDEMLCADVK